MKNRLLLLLCRCLKNDLIMGREILKKTPKGHKSWMVCHKENIKTGTQKKLGSRNLTMEITQKKKSQQNPSWLDGPGQSRIKTLTSTEPDNYIIFEYFDQKKHQQKR